MLVMQCPLIAEWSELAKNDQSVRNWPHDQSSQNWRNGANLKVKWERYLTGDAREGIMSEFARLIMMVRPTVSEV